MTAEETTIWQVRLPLEVKRQGKAFAAVHGMSEGELVAEAVRRMLAQKTKKGNSRMKPKPYLLRSSVDESLNRYFDTYDELTRYIVETEIPADECTIEKLIDGSYQELD